ncbi:MAG TPA: [protein-PII] uridylyltransferase [Pirellulales bacterium]|jgi:[protein-PII] uridylyltransferase|nr:[protein-PII] uridylyltransferase [Pirellulales bacterium]
MTVVPAMRANVRAAKERLAEGREKLRLRHERGSPGIQVSGALAELFDGVVIELFEAALGELGDMALGECVALVAHGGYGRRDVAPFSDIDLMLLHAPRVAGRVAPLAQRMVRDLFDAGLVPGQSVRTPAQASRLARKDATVCTSLAESRWLAGSEWVYRKFFGRFRQQAQRHAARLTTAIERARRTERRQFGETVYLLEPNVKRSRGGLRDIQLLRWIGFVRYGLNDPDGLRLHGALSPADYDAIRRAQEFLLRLRNEMHFHSAKSCDLLDRVEQLRLAEWYGFKGDVGLLPVEQFMREYFRLTDGVSRVVQRFVASSRGRSRWGAWLAPLVSHRFERDFRVGPTQIAANAGGLAKLQGDLAQILRLADVANHCDKSIDHATCEAIRAAVPGLPDEISGLTARKFLSLLSRPARLASLLRLLHEMGVLEKIIPAFTHARCLLQFNEYHKYTVDEHCLRAVEMATELERNPGPLGGVYRRLQRKWLLHLALLLHDLGKGYAEDHSEVGLRIARQTAERLQLAERDAETLCFLVHKHLLMTHLAFRRDTSDSQLVVEFAVQVGSPEVMQMLFVLSAADLAAVGPGVLNAWKVDVLADLHRRAMQHLAGEAPALVSGDGVRQRRAAVLACLDDESHSAWFEKQLAELPVGYLFAMPPSQLAAELGQWRSLARGDVLALGRYQAETGTVEYKVGAYEDVTPGVFHRLAGALAHKGLTILSAEIHTLADGLIFDRFYVHDPDFAGPPPPARIDDVRNALVASLRRPNGAQPVFRRVWRAGAERRPAVLAPPPTRVLIDNATSRRHTIFDVFAADRMGLLYTIARTLFEAGLSVSVAKIGTYLDQVVDVFYVTDHAGHKVVDEQRLKEIQERLMTSIAELAQQEAAGMNRIQAESVKGAGARGDEGVRGRGEEGDDK